MWGESFQVLHCIGGALNLLNSTSANGLSGGGDEWAKAPTGKESVIFWSRIPPSIPFSAISQIRGGFLLSSTLLGALTRMPGVGDLEGCDWSCQEGMWAANSKGLIDQMPSGKPEYFLTGMNILEEVTRPFKNTVAFRIELPALAAAQDEVKFGDVHLASLHEGLTCEDLTLAVKVAFRTEKKIRLRCARCHHCLDKSDSCVAKCIQGARKEMDDQAIAAER